MPSHADDKLTLRHAFTRTRNAWRFYASGRPAPQAQRMGKLARKGLNPAVRAQLKVRRTPWAQWAKHNAGVAGQYGGNVRVTAQNILTNRPGAVPTFVGIGLDENIATRVLNTRANWVGIRKRAAKDIFEVRSRNADLVWYNPPPNPAAAAGAWPPIAGHTPGIKSAAVGGTAGAITTGHGNGQIGNGRDGIRESAVTRSVQDMASPDRFLDTAVMGALATIKHMSDPSTRLNLAKPHVAALPTARYAALTGNNDLRQPATFDSLVDHVQEERERKKWEVGSVMHGDNRLQGMVPPVIRSYLASHGNQPHTAMEAFRSDLHHAWFKPSVNTSVESDTRDLTTKSLNQMATKTNTTGRRQRSLSDARVLPAVAPPNSRGQ
ncbi:hypothetical protein [Pinirhizobacter sp.]|jgi:hypothetical protein|uniref:hypothetical protein n=1 Tax=Pinirhizobacter sp. TaxID=2950432 RepID=UPI002F42E75F